MYLSEQLQKKWEGVLDHPDMPAIKDPYRKAVTAVVLENTEKALREQEQDDTRAAEAGEDKSASMPSAFSQLLLEQKAFTEWYKTVPPELKPHYQKMVDRYYQLINK